MRDGRKKFYRHYKGRPITIDGVDYPSIKFAAIMRGVTSRELYQYTSYRRKVDLGELKFKGKRPKDFRPQAPQENINRTELPAKGKWSFNDFSDYDLTE